MYSHVGRLGNQAAHYLAKHDLGHPIQIWIEETPPMIANCIFAYLLINYFFRQYFVYKLL